MHSRLKLSRSLFSDVTVNKLVPALAADASELGLPPGEFPESFEVDGVVLKREGAEWRNFASEDRELLSVSYAGLGLLATVFND